jgi:hypothetical protein
VKSSHIILVQNTTGKWVQMFCIVFLSVTIPVGTTTAAKLITAEQIQQNRFAAEKIISEFTQASAHLRLLLEYRGNLGDDETKDELLGLWRKASARLEKIYLQQQEICKQIEVCTDKKWDELYGDTGLWRKAAADVRQSMLYKAQLDYFAAAGSVPAERTQILHEIITVCTSLGQTGDFLKAKSQQLLSDCDDTYKIHAINTLGDILARPGTGEEVYLAAAITRLRLSEKCDRQQIRELAKAIKASNLTDDFELNLKLAFLQVSVCSESNLLEELVSKFPAAALFIGDIILADIAVSQQPGHLITKSKFEIDLAIKTAISKGVEQYTKLLAQLAKFDRFSGPLLYYAIAQAYSQTKPKDAVEYYLKAAELAVDKTLEVSQIQIARQAGQLAYKLYCDDQAYCHTALEVLEYYHQLADSQADEEMLWLYASVSYDCGQETKAVKILKDIAAANGTFSNQARLDLTIHKIRRNQLHTIEPLIEAVEILADDFSENQQNDCYRSREGLLVLASVIEQIERCQSVAGGAGDANNFTTQLDKLAEFCMGCASSEFTDNTKLLRIETGIIAADGDSGKLDELDQVLEDSFAGIDNIDLIRIRARMAQGRSNFTDATKGWGRICSALKPANGNKPTEQWWQGKFGQLYCWSQLKETRPAKVSHAIEVLQEDFNIPGFWAEKIAEIQKSEPLAK